MGKKPRLEKFFLAPLISKSYLPLWQRNNEKSLHWYYSKDVNALVLAGTEMEKNVLLFINIIRKNFSAY